MTLIHSETGRDSSTQSGGHLESSHEAVITLCWSWAWGGHEIPTKRGGVFEGGSWDLTWTKSDRKSHYKNLESLIMHCAIKGQTKRNVLYWDYAQTNKNWFCSFPPSQEREASYVMTTLLSDLTSLLNTTMSWLTWLVVIWLMD